MIQRHWELLLDVIKGRSVNEIPLGFIVDCPWLPGWADLTTIDYFASDEAWLSANLKAIQTFPELMFLPGFWAEYGMCTEPAAFGAKCIWHTHDMPFAERIIHTPADIDRLEIPNPQNVSYVPRSQSVLGCA